MARVPAEVQTPAASREAPQRVGAEGTSPGAKGLGWGGIRTHGVQTRQFSRLIL